MRSTPSSSVGPSRARARSAEVRRAAHAGTRAAIQASRQTAGRGTDRTLELRVGISATAKVRKPRTAIAAAPPTQASRAPASTGANGITDIETNFDVDRAEKAERHQDARVMVSDVALRLTREEADQFTEELHQLADSWRRRGRSSRDGARTYQLLQILQPARDA